MERRILEAIRDAADPFDARPEDVLKRARMDRNALVRAIGTLRKRGLVDVDDESGALRLTDAGTATLDPDDPGLPKVSAAEPPGPIWEIDTGPKALPAGYAIAGGRLPEPAPSGAPSIKIEAPAPGPLPQITPQASLPVRPKTSLTKRPARQPKGPAMTEAAAEAAVRQVKDVAVATIRRQMAKKATKSAAKAAKAPRSSERHLARMPKVARPKRATPKDKGEKTAPQVRSIAPAPKVARSKRTAPKAKPGGRTSSRTARRPARR